MTKNCSQSVNHSAVFVVPVVLVTISLFTVETSANVTGNSCSCRIGGPAHQHTKAKQVIRFGCCFYNSLKLFSQLKMDYQYQYYYDYYKYRSFRFGVNWKGIHFHISVTMPVEHDFVGHSIRDWVQSFLMNISGHQVRWRVDLRNGFADRTSIASILTASVCFVYAITVDETQSSRRRVDMSELLSNNKVDYMMISMAMKIMTIYTTFSKTID